jgi:hypothetical protein
MFLVALGSVCMTFGALEISSKSCDFSWLSRGGGRLRAYTHLWGSHCSRGAHTTIFANKTSSYNALTVYKATKYQIYKTGTINKLTCSDVYKDILHSMVAH